MRARWITIGTVQLGWYVRLGNAGYPDGLAMHWRGRTHVFQPAEFLTWTELLTAVRVRLELAGLRLLAIASVLGPPRAPAVPLWWEPRRVRLQVHVARV